eukprot:2521827-Rhodomonas_salina.1
MASALTRTRLGAIMMTLANKAKLRQGIMRDLAYFNWTRCHKQAEGSDGASHWFRSPRPAPPASARPLLASAPTLQPAPTSFSPEVSSVH